MTVSGENGLAPLRIANASEVAFQAIRQAIIDGDLAPGQRLREVALARQLGISATPVREALARLQAEGLITFTPRRGAVVPCLEPQDVVEVYELRELLEAHAARRAAEKRAAGEDVALLTRLATLVEEGERLVAARRVADYNQLDVAFHQTLMDLASNWRLRRVFDTVHAQVQAVRLRAITLPGRPARSQEEHARLVAAILRADADAAEAEIRHHVASVKEEVLAVLAAGRQPAGRITGVNKTGRSLSAEPDAVAQLGTAG